VSPASNVPFAPNCNVADFVSWIAGTGTPFPVNVMDAVADGFLLTADNVAVS
jgi:hypothetical protein